MLFCSALFNKGGTEIYYNCEYGGERPACGICRDDGDYSIGNEVCHYEHINLAEGHKACQHNDHWCFCITGAAERAGIYLIYSAKEIEGRHKVEEHCSVGYCAFYIDEECYESWSKDHYRNRENNG